MKRFVLAKLVAFLACWAFVGCTSMELQDPPTPRSFVVGQTAAMAAQTMQDLGYDVIWYGPDLDLLDDSWTPGEDQKVVWQDPLHDEAAQAQDKDASFNGSFEIVVGPVELLPQLWVTIPDMSDLTVSQARAKASSLGLRLAVYDEDGNSAAGNPNSVVLANHSATPAGATTHIGATIGVIIIVNRS